MNEELLQHLLKQIEEKLSNYGARIDIIESKQAETNVRIDNLCKSIDDLTSTIKWLMGLIITSLVGFFIFIIEKNLF